MFAVETWKTQHHTILPKTCSGGYSYLPPDSASLRTDVWPSYVNTALIKQT